MKRIHILAICCTFALAAACGLGSMGSSGKSSAVFRSGWGRLNVEMVDAPTQQVKEIIVSITKVTAHSNTAGWVTIRSNPLTIDILKLKDYAIQLGFADLPAGKVTQIRLYTDPAAQHYVTLPDGTKADLKVPSGSQSGIKIHGPFDINSCSTTAVTIDFDGHKSIWYHPTGTGLWILRPVIHVKKATSEQGTCLGDGGSSSNPGDNGTNPGDGETGTSGDGGSSSTDGGSGTNPGDTGGVCSVNSECGGGGEICASGHCSPAGAGSPCTQNSSCLSGACSNGTCEPGGPSAPCRVGSDCASAECTGDGVCAPGSAGGTGSSCTQNSQCLSNTCTAGACEAGDQGAPCNTASDCSPGFQCTTGNVCEYVLG